MIKQSRWKSPMVYTAVVAQLITIGLISGVFEKYSIDSKLITAITAAVLQIFVIVGILNNPENAAEL